MISDAPPRGFPEAEFAARTARAQDQMAKANLDALFLTTEAEIRYFTGFHTLFWQSPTRPWYLIVPASGKPVAVIPEIGAVLMRSTWIDDIRTWSAPAPEDDGLSLVCDLLGELGVRHLGVPKGHETTLRMPLADYETMVGRLPDIRMEDATGLIRHLRMVKSEAEIAKIAHACAIGSATFARVPDIVREGLPLEDLFRSFRREALNQGADDVPYLVGGADQGGYHDVISPPSRRPLQKGDILMLDTGMTWDGYFCDFDRNFAIGRASEPAKRAYDQLWDATEAGLAAARPGITCRDLLQAMQSVLPDPGGDVGRSGHGLGMQLTEQPSLAAFDDTILEENMVLTLEPSLTYADDRLMVHEENIVIRANGPQLLTTRAAAQLPII